MRSLILDDDKAVCEFIASVLEESGVTYEIFLDPLQALESMNGSEYDFAFIDIGLPNMNGLEFSKRFKERYPESDIVFITGYGDYDKAVQAIKVGAYDFLKKAFKRLDISMCVARLIEKRRLYQAQKRKQVLDFANQVSLQLMHELRNPLTAIGGFSRLAYTKDCPEDQLKEYARVIFDQTVRLEKVFNKVLQHLKAGAEQL
ncbi:MAG: response regulator [Deltaproteobacteria bacterium]|nr:response regulator [Deltaproteobacteria bacterium]MBW2019412.1 response regulator [Deltaproteobacteria bacterium]MBW2074249.1 response regulator [Deltaproteobacteria bacterium]